MKHRIAAILLSGLASSSVAATPRWSPGDRERLDMFVGDARELDIDATRIVVGNGKLLSVRHLGGNRLLLLAGAAGTTALQVWRRDGVIQQWLVNIDGLSPAALLDQVQLLIAGLKNVTARAVGEHVLLEGHALSSMERERVAAIGKAFAGRILDQTDRQGWDTMLLFEVRILELRRSASDKLGIRWNFSADGPAAQLSERDGGARVLHLKWTSELGSRLELLRAHGEARIVAEPNLSCRSGGSARFVSGGELPVPVVNAQGTPDVQYREYGVILDIKPSVDEDGNVYAQIDTEVSGIDPSVQVMNVPAILKRRSTTEVNVRLGETVVMAGLLDRSSGEDRSALPGLGRLPLAGGLFRARSSSSQDSELVVLITPRRLASAPAANNGDANREWLERGERQAGGSAAK